MLSLKKGRAVAVINGGKYNGESIRIFDPDTDRCCDDCSDKCGKKGVFCCDKCVGIGGCLKCDEAKIEYDDPFDIIDEDYIMKNKRGKFSRKQMTKLVRSLKDGTPLNDDEYLEDIRGSALKEIDRRCRKDFEVPDNGTVTQLPNFEKSERLYVCGPSDSGKTYFVSKYIQQWRKIFKKGKIFVISDVDHDEQIDKYKVKRIMIGDNLLEEPLEAKDFPEGSLVIFDD